MERKVINVPIEPLEERYTKQWSKWFATEFQKHRLDTHWVWGKALTNTIETGTFLDIVSTNHYKATQLMKLCQRIQLGGIIDGDIIFFHDLWFPGIEMLFYIRDGIGLNIKICGCLHAGTYDPTDFISKQGMGYWGRFLEEGWFQAVDTIFVGTHWHKSLILKSRKCDPSKIKVTGFPIYSSEIRKEKQGPRKNIVVFPHRLNEDKNPQDFDHLAMVLSQKLQSWEFIKTQEIRRTKSEYYDLLNQSKIAVSFASHENWGIGMQEALFSGCIPLVPNRLAYTEMYPTELKYESIEELYQKVLDAADQDPTLIKAATETSDYLSALGRKAIPNIVNIMMEEL